MEFAAQSYACETILMLVRYLRFRVCSVVGAGVKRLLYDQSEDAHKENNTVNTLCGGCTTGTGAVHQTDCESATLLEIHRPSKEEIQP